MVRRMATYLGFGIAGLALLAVGAWVYVAWSVETPDYAVLEKDGAIELRDYPALVLAEARTSGPRRAALGDGFRPLARYIFASDRDGPKIAMTAPVVQSAGDAPESWTVGFVMPKAHERAALPAPSQGGVTLRTQPPRRVAAIRFSGLADDASLRAREAELRDWMAAKGLQPQGAPVYAYYNDPWTPGFLRRNEVLIGLGE